MRWLPKQTKEGFLMIKKIIIWYRTRTIKKSLKKESWFTSYEK